MEELTQRMAALELALIELAAGASPDLLEAARRRLSRGPDWIADEEEWERRQQALQLIRDAERRRAACGLAVGAGRADSKVFPVAMTAAAGRSGVQGGLNHQTSTQA